MSWTIEAAGIAIFTPRQAFKPKLHSRLEMQCWKAPPSQHLLCAAGWQCECACYTSGGQCPFRPLLLPFSWYEWAGRPPSRSCQPGSAGLAVPSPKGGGLASLLHHSPRCCREHLHYLAENCMSQLASRKATCAEYVVLVVPLCCSTCLYGMCGGGSFSTKVSRQLLYVPTSVPCLPE